MLRYDGPVIRYLAKAGDMILLNVLWVLCSLPIVTFGAATAAAHYVALKFVRDEGTSAASMFFRAFRRNLRQGCVLGLISHSPPCYDGDFVAFGLSLCNGDDLCMGGNGPF